MKRWLLSLACAVLATVVILGFALVGIFSGPGKDAPDDRKVAVVFYFALAWPLLILYPIFGTVEVGRLSQQQTLVLLLFHLFTYCLLAYGFFTWRSKSKT